MNFWASDGIIPVQLPNIQSYPMMKDQNSKSFVEFAAIVFKTLVFFNKFFRVTTYSCQAFWN